MSSSPQQKAWLFFHKNFFLVGKLCFFFKDIEGLSSIDQILVLRQRMCCDPVANTLA